MLRRIVKNIFKKLYKIEVEGLENLEKAGDRVLIIANHLSFLDGFLLALFLPKDTMFAINTFTMETWYFKPLLSQITAFSLDPNNPMATKSIITEINKNKKCVIFPEGRITTTGSLMKVYEGPGMIADKTGAKILPVRLDGAQYTKFFSRLSGKVKLKLFPKITIKILEPYDFNLDPNLTGRERRFQAGMHLYDLMSNMMFDTSNYNQTLFQSLINQKDIHGRKHIIAEDVNRKPISYGHLISSAFTLGQKIYNRTDKGEHVGILMPNMITTMTMFFALQAFNRVATMLNFSAGIKNIVAACHTAEVKIVYTSRAFIEKSELQPIIEALKEEKITICYLEDMQKQITIFDKLKGMFQSYFAQSFYDNIADDDANDEALILFTSGSEGTPKGVVLTHKNILSNTYQLASRVDFGPTDIVFNALPLFHSFGLTGGMLLPLLSGIKIFFYPSPLHYRIVPELVYDSNATIMFGTDTFLSGYAKFAHPYDFYAIRYVFAGAEKLKETTRKLWSEKYGVRIFEGYGVTETSPVISTNTPMHNKIGTVGKFLPAINYKLVDVPGVEEGGRLVVSGPNVMKGYLLHDRPGQLVPVENNEYDTGDIVSVDNEGYITILGRAKRFAKIAGEMISLTAVESFIAKLWSEYDHAVISIPDDKKGESLVLFTTNKNANVRDISAYAKEIGVTELSVPKKINIIDKLPLLGTGKVDYVFLKGDI